MQINSIHELLEVTSLAFDRIEEMGFSESLESYVISEFETKRIYFHEGVEPLDNKESPMGFIKLQYSSKDNWVIEIGNKELKFVNSLADNDRVTVEELKDLYFESSQVYYIDFDNFEKDLPELTVKIIAFLGAAVCELYDLATGN